MPLVYLLVTRTARSVGQDASQPDDAELVERAQQGDRDAFGTLVDRYQEKVYSICYGKLKDEQDSLDVTQDVFVKVFRYLEDFNHNSSFYTWLYRIAVNTSIDFLRKQSRQAQVDYDDSIKSDEDVEGHDNLTPSTLGVEPDRAYNRKELRNKMLEALESLSDKHRTILNLREVEGLSYKEMADVLDISKGTVMSRLYHARQYFQEALDEYLDGSVSIE
jgi:RNA polymerase sigma-70 factor (ECF subfamily)